MITKPLYSAANLFKRAAAEPGTDAAKLQDIRSRLVLRNRETRMAERQHRLERRVVGSSTLFAQ